MVMEAAHRIAAGAGAKVDDRDAQSPGAKFFHWEKRGVPIVLELGPRDVASGNIVLKRRDTGGKQVLPQDGVAAAVQEALNDVDPPRSQPAAKLLLLKKIQLKENIAFYSQPRSHGSAYWPVISLLATIKVQQL